MTSSKSAAHRLKVLLVCIAGALMGCSQQTPTAPPTSHLHKDVPLHGGTPVDLGEDYHLELVLDAPTGKMDAYVFDDEFESFVRTAAKSFQVTAHWPGRDEVLDFKAVPNSATGETVGDTSMFETQADWLKGKPVFDAVLVEITVGATSYTNVAFNFPKGSDEDTTK